MQLKALEALEDEGSIDVAYGVQRTTSSALGISCETILTEASFAQQWILKLSEVSASCIPYCSVL